MNFPNVLLLLIANFIPLWSESILCMISILLFLLRLVCGLSCKMFRLHLKGSCILLLLCEMFCRCISLVFLCFLVLFYFLVDVLLVLSVIESGVLMFPTIIVELCFFFSLTFRGLFLAVSAPPLLQSSKLLDVLLFCLYQSYQPPFHCSLQILPLFSMMALGME